MTEQPEVTRLGRVLARVREPVDGAGLAAFRILLGAVLVFQTVRFFANGWVESLWLAPEFHFTWAGFDWVRPLPRASMYVLLAVQLVAACALLLGYRTRVAALVFCLAFTYGELIDKAIYLNHYYLVSLLTLLCVFLPVSATLSLDARRRGEQLVPRGAYTLLRVQIACVYVFAGLAKLSPDWLVMGEPLRTWLQHHHDLWLVGPLLDTPLAALTMSWAGMIHDLLIVPALLWRRTRALAFAFAAVFHLAIWALFPVGVFSFVMLATVTVCFDPSWPRRFARAMPKPVSMPRVPSRLALGAAIVWVVIQVVVPLRHLVYPGTVNWTEQGFRFAWRVMLIEKTGHVDFEVMADGKRIAVLKRPDLTSVQDKQMATQPDMIHDYAHHLADAYRARGYRHVEVRADAWVALNGRPARRIIDPTADLAASPRGPAAKPWLLPPE